MSPVVLFPLYLLVIFAPLGLSWVQGIPTRPLQDEIAAGLGMTAFSILLSEFVLSGRFRMVSARIGMDVTMRAHQLVARAALAFVLLHPFLYSTPLFNHRRPWDVSSQMTLGLDIETAVTGIVGFILFVGIVVMAIWRDQLPFRYEVWRLLHGIFAIVVAAVITHHTLGAGRYSADPVLAVFWLLLLSIAFGCAVRTYFLIPWRQAADPYEVSEVRKLALSTWELTIRRCNGNTFKFDAGQFVWLNVGNNPFSLYENPFSISSAPADRSRLQFVVKEVGDMTRSIAELQPGATTYLDGPYGNLTLRHREGAGIALIAGGVGIAPLLSIARQLVEECDPRPLCILYGNRKTEQIVYASELQKLARRPQTEVVHILSEPPAEWRGLTGMIDGSTIKNVFGSAQRMNWLYLVCGPPAMLDVVEAALSKIGVPDGQVVSERFYYA